MQESFYSMICQMGTFMICAQAMIQFRPRESYGKYLKMLLSLMILVQLFQPFRNIFWGTTAQDFQTRIAYFQEEIEMRMQAAAESAGMSEQKLQKMTLLEVQERLKQQEEQIPALEETMSETNGKTEEATLEEGLETAMEEDVTSVQEGVIGVKDVKIKVEWDAEE